MKRDQWPYPYIDEADFLAQIDSVERILQKQGAEYIEDCCEKNTCILSNGSCMNEVTQKHIWKKENEYLRVDRIYFPDKPFLVLEFSKCKEGSYEDADPFPYDLSDFELEQEIGDIL